MPSLKKNVITKKNEFEVEKAQMGSQILRYVKLIALYCMRKKDARCFFLFLSQCDFSIFFFLLILRKIAKCNILQTMYI